MWTLLPLVLHNAPTMNEATPNLVNRMIGPFKLTRAIGSGGMGAVYRAIDGRSQQTVAVKLLLRPHEANSEWLVEARRLRDEAKVASRFDFPHIVKMIDTGEDEALGPYVVYEYLSRGSLSDYLKKNEPLSFQETLSRVARPLLLALGQMHAAGIVHRDIKPANLFEGDDGTFKVGDLGLALFENRMAQTVQGALVGTPGYLAPERVHHPERPATTSVDCYGAALVIIKASTGQLPFRGEDPIDLVYDQLNREVTPRDLTQMGIPQPGATVLASALQRNPEFRLSSADEMLAEISRQVVPSQLRDTLKEAFEPMYGLRDTGVTTQKLPWSHTENTWMYLLAVALLLTAMMWICL